MAPLRDLRSARAGTAIGITSSGIGTSIFLVVPTCQWLIDTVGWRWTWRIAGVVVCAWIVPAALFLIKDPPRASAPATTVPLDIRGTYAPAFIAAMIAAAVSTAAIWGVGRGRPADAGHARLKRRREPGTIPA